LTGELTIDKEQEIVSETKKHLIEMKEKIPAYSEYLNNWGDWEPWP
jgi:hypothetical protein